MSVGTFLHFVDRGLIGQWVRCLLPLVVACFVPACGRLTPYSDQEPEAADAYPEYAIGLTYWEVTRDATGELLSSGCIATGSGTRFGGYPTFPVPKGESYTILRHGGQRASGSEIAEAACSEGPESTVTTFSNRRCIRALRPTDTLLRADLLDATGRVVTYSESERRITLDGAFERFTLVSEESGTVLLDHGNLPCKADYLTEKFPIEVTSSN